ncbi:MAG TPA: hypothetical protein VEB66_07975 [Opitutaceae bacterium]|nr:hypothetical protein [Opitutaceae bacterium]
MRTLRLFSPGLLMAALALTAAATAPATSANPAIRASDRQHHYIFANRVMPRLFFRDATKLSNALADRRAELLRAMWVDLGEQFFSSAQIPPDGIDVLVPAPERGASIVLLVFPKPAASAEAYFAALVTMPDGGLHYLTLERSFDLLGTGQDVTVLGGWDAEGGHLNYGEGARPVLADFERQVRAFIGKPPQVHAPANAETKPRTSAPSGD